MRLLTLALALAAPLAAAQPAPDSRPDRAVLFEALGPYLLGVSAAYEARGPGPVLLRGSVGLRDADLFGPSDGHLAVGAAALVTAGGRWVGVEGGAGLSLAFSQRDVYRDGGFRSRGAGLIPHVEGGVRASLPVGSTLDGRRLHRDVVVRAGLSVVYDPQDLDADDSVDYGGPVVVLPTFGAGLAF